MANLTNFGADAIWNGTPPPATMYGKLHLGNPTDAGTASPAAETTRKSITRTVAAGGLACSNVGVLVWVPYLYNETISHISVWDHVSAGNCWFVGALPAPVICSIDEAVYLAAGSITFLLSTY